MNVEISSRVLPGIGVCQEIELRDEHRIGIVTRRTGLRDLVVYDEDGDGSAISIALTDDEANAVAEILGAPQLTSRLSALQLQAEGLVVEQLPMPSDSPYARRPLGETQVRTLTGASIVAVLRRSAAIPSPTPDFVLMPGDLVVTVGTQDAVDQVAHILAGTSHPALHPDTDHRSSG
ncbi:potassium/proton antiporter regulatory subunit, CPA2 family [Frankineae bacterium MT45]|nr:potassium/proton antiporter regulatory subunit, CPA2 family [Frankineae bacterium MT45]